MRDVTKGLLAGCVYCGEPFTRGDIENEAISEIRKRPGELVHTACIEGSIEKALARLEQQGRIRKEWDGKDWRYFANA